MRKLCLLLVVGWLAQQAGAETVWIDTDVSIGSPIREVDDAYALILAFHSQEIRIAGISTTYGNASLGHTNRVTSEMVREFGRPARLNPDQIFSGATSPRVLERRTHASEALAAVLRKETLTYIALGPLTNLASFIKLHPELADRINRVIFLGGKTPGSVLAFGPKRSFHIHDANVFKDPAAAAIVLGSKIPLVLMPVESTSRLLIDASDMREIQNSGPAGNYLARRSRIWLWFWKHFVKIDGGPIFDAFAILPVTRPGLLTMKERYAALDRSGNLIITPSRTPGTRRVRYCTDFAPETKRFMMRRFGTPRRGE